MSKCWHHSEIFELNLLAVDPSALAVLDSYDDESGPEPFINTVIKTFLEKSPSLLTRIENAISSSSPKQVQIGAHSLKSSSANIGAKPFSDICQSLENMSTSEMNWESAEKLICQLKLEFEVIVRELKVILDFLISKRNNSASY